MTFNSRIHFYNMKSSLMQRQMLVVLDLDNTFVLLPYDLLANLFESRTVVDAFLDGLPSMFENTPQAESAFRPAVKVLYQNILLDRYIIIGISSLLVRERNSGIN
ncbi:protein transport protein Sec24-like At3g07100 [Coffea eugenioides]|uniref:protein transport protein Sec24-like At3g07100 n=1 Tax=Coffea eugenioides TaxID=49369 RepID=UPI000F60CD38|nr:protein transport protein Sec24-like At3g07100 [Coffea eugenioides]